MSHYRELITVLEQIEALSAPLLPFVRGCEGTLWIAGNGGSMATAQHWACDLSKAAGRRVQALGSNPAVLTAFANDEGYDQALAWELLRLAQPGDTLICLSCSGTSRNITSVLEQAAIGSLPRSLVTAQRESFDRFPVDVLIELPSTDYGILEDCFQAIGHWLTRELCATR